MLRAVAFCTRAYVKFKSSGTVGLGDSIDSIHNCNSALLSSNAIVAKLSIRIAHVIQQVSQVRVTTALYQTMALVEAKASLRKLNLSHWKELAARFGNTFVFLVKTASVLRGTNESKMK